MGAERGSDNVRRREGGVLAANIACFLPNKVVGLQREGGKEGGIEGEREGGAVQVVEKGNTITYHVLFYE